MRKDLHLFALWTLAILAAAVVVILYQHATHTSLILGLVGGGTGASGVDPANTAANDDSGPLGGQSRASGVWTPTGPSGMSIFPLRAVQPGTSNVGG